VERDLGSQGGEHLLQGHLGKLVEKKNAMSIAGAILLNISASGLL